MPPKADAACKLCFTTLAAHLMPMFVEVMNLKHLCLRCRWEVKDHPVVPEAPPQVVAQVAPGPQAAQVAPAAAAARAEVAAPGPKASLALVQESPLAFLGVIAAWKNSSWCADDSDKVNKRMEEVQGAWVRGAYRVVSKHLRVLGAPEDINRTFEYKALPADVPDPVAYRQERGLEILACQRLADAVLDLAQAYARRRCIVDKVANQVLIHEDLRTDEWFAILETKRAVARAGPGELEPAESEFATPDKSLWWFFMIASVETTHMQARLERCVREWGASYRAKNPKSFCARAVWDAEYSPEVVAARRADRSERAALTAAVLAVGAKRGRDPNHDSPNPRTPGRASTPKEGQGLSKSAKKKLRLARLRERRDAAGGSGGGAAEGGDDDYDDDADSRFLSSHSPSVSRSLATTSGGGPASTLQRSVPSTSSSRGQFGASPGRGKSGSGRSGGRGRGGRSGDR